MSITAKELAKKLNLSAAAVSMALNNKPGVSSITRRTIFDAAEKYGYDFSKIPEKQTLTGPLYFVLYKKHGAIVSDTPFFSSLIEGITMECSRENLTIQIKYIYDDEDTISRQIEDLQYSDCSGIILLGTEMNPEDLVPFMELPVPLVVLDTYFETTPCNYVLINNVQGAFLATNYLIRKCKNQPGYLRSSYPISNFAERANGFFKAVRSAGMHTSGSITHSLSPSAEGAYADMKEIILRKEKLATCYFADNDLIAVGAMKALKEFGFKIPEDVAIVGFDNLPISSIIEPGLTTINVPKQYMGQVAVQRILTLINKPKVPPLKIDVSTTLIKRRTV